LTWVSCARRSSFCLPPSIFLTRARMVDRSGKDLPANQPPIDHNRHSPAATSFLPSLEWVQAGISGSYSVKRNDVDVRVKERFFGPQSSLLEAARSRTTACFSFDFARLAYRKGCGEICEVINERIGDITTTIPRAIARVSRISTFSICSSERSLKVSAAFVNTSSSLAALGSAAAQARSRGARFGQRHTFISFPELRGHGIRRLFHNAHPWKSKGQCDMAICVRQD
jgi:hypothetical protein